MATCVLASYSGVCAQLQQRTYQRRAISVSCGASSSNQDKASYSRRATLAAVAATQAAPLLWPGWGAAAAEAAPAEQANEPSLSEADTTVTQRLYLDIGVCPEAIRIDRTLGDKTPFCTDPQPLGRLVVELFGKAAPGSVAAIVAAARAGAYDNTALSKVLPGRYIVAGAQGPKRSGLVQAPPGLPRNEDILNSAAFRLQHRRPGTVSLNLSENVDEEYIRFNKGYCNLSLLITTGPGPVPSLDGENIVVGQLTPDSLEVVRAITAVPTFTPNGNARSFNSFAKFIGDERADKTASKWGRPLQAIIIRAAGVL